MSFGKMAVDWQQRLDFDKLRNGRIERANKMLHKYGVGAVACFGWDNGRYLSSLFNHPYARHLPSHIVLLIRDAGFPYVFIMKMDEQRLKEYGSWVKNRLVFEEGLLTPRVYRMMPTDMATKEWGKTADEIKSLMKKHQVSDLPLAIDWTGLNAVNAFQKASIKLVDGNAMMQEARMVKLDEEIELMRLAATCNENGYAQVVKALRPGMRENDAQAIMAKGVYEAGAEYIEGWVVNSGERAAPRSFNWSDRTIRPGELLSLEACHVTFCGYKVCYDRTFAVGTNPTELQQEIYKTPVEMHKKLQKLLRPGVTTHELARAKVPEAGLLKSVEEIQRYRSGWTNHFGGIGSGWDEPPYIDLAYPSVKLEKNMILAYHCLFWVEGYAGVAIENTYRITDTGFEIMTKWPWEELMVCGLP